MKLNCTCEVHYVPLPPEKEKDWMASLKAIVQEVELYDRTNRSSWINNEPESAGDPVDSVAAIHEERTNNETAEHSKDAGNSHTLGKFTG